MSAEEFTPGPWRLVERDDRTGFAEIYAGVIDDDVDAEWQVATAWDGMKEAPYNANLIAAAPDLYEALQVALSYAGPSDEWVSAARTALAKARGEK